MMWLAINSIGTVHHTPQIRMWGGDEMIEAVYDESEKIIKIGDSEFYGRLNLDDELVIVDDRKFNYAADFWREFKKQLKDAEDAAYKRGLEDGRSKLETNSMTKDEVVNALSKIIDYDLDFSGSSEYEVERAIKALKIAIKAIDNMEVEDE